MAMETNILVLFLMLSLILSTQITALLIQHRFNGNSDEMGVWLRRTLVMALAFIYMPIISAVYWTKISGVTNFLLILSHLLIFYGLRNFLGRRIKTNRFVVGSIFIMTLYFYFVFIDNNPYIQNIIVSIIITIVALFIALDLLNQKDSLKRSVSRYIAFIFFIYSSFYAFRAVTFGIINQGHILVSKEFSLFSTVTISIVTSNLWVFGLIIMINRKLYLENRSEKEKFQHLFNTNVAAQLITRFDDAMIVDVNDEFIRLTGYDKDLFLGKPLPRDLGWKDPLDRKTFVDNLVNKGYCEDLEFVFYKKDGSEFTGIVSAKTIIIDDALHIMTTIRDITEYRTIRDALIESEETYRSILNASPNDITITDLEGKILIVSPAGKKMFGYDEDFDKFVGMNILDFIIPGDVERARSNILKKYSDGLHRINEYVGVKKNGSLINLEVSSGFIYDVKGKPDKMVFIIRDITKRKIIEEKLEKLVVQLELERNTAETSSITDGLTGLYNRRHFDLELKKELSRTTRTFSDFSLIMVDIDHFKKFNDSYGHISGDQCLQRVATAIKDNTERTSDLVARYGGEEFIIIVPNTDEMGAKALGEKIRIAVENLAILHMGSRTSKFVTISVGITTVDYKDTLTADKALTRVDTALYLAKANGRNRCVYKH